MLLIPLIVWVLAAISSSWFAPAVIAASSSDHESGDPLLTLGESTNVSPEACSTTADNSSDEEGNDVICQELKGLQFWPDGRCLQKNVSCTSPHSSPNGIGDCTYYYL